MEDAARRFHLRSFTPVEIPPCPRLCGLDDYYFFIGSCFSGNMYRFCRDHFLHTMTSPFGTTYNPLSIAHSLSLLLDGEKIREDDIFFHQGLYRHFSFHSLAAKTDKEEFIRTTRQMTGDGSSFLKKTAVLVITFGTAFGYFHKKTGKVVNNCHTLPAGEFTRELIPLRDMVTRCTQVLAKAKKQNPGLFIIFTLSPVRHLRDRADENSLSKAILRCAVHELLSLPDTWYFPAYEIILDELRDYRYYKEDLCHPGETAVRYVMDRFASHCFTPDTCHYLEKAARLRAKLDHKPRHPGSEEHKKFCIALEKEILQLQEKYPGLEIPGAGTITSKPG